MYMLYICIKVYNRNNEARSVKDFYFGLAEVQREDYHKGGIQRKMFEIQSLT